MSLFILVVVAFFLYCIVEGILSYGDDDDEEGLF